MVYTSRSGFPPRSEANYLQQLQNTFSCIHFIWYVYKQLVPSFTPVCPKLLTPVVFWYHVSQTCRKDKWRAPSMCPFCQRPVHLLLRRSACVLHFPKVLGVWNMWPQWQKRLLSTVVLNRPNLVLVGEHPHSHLGQTGIHWPSSLPVLPRQGMQYTSDQATVAGQRAALLSPLLWTLVSGMSWVFGGFWIFQNMPQSFLFLREGHSSSTKQECNKRVRDRSTELLWLLWGL